MSKKKKKGLGVLHGKILDVLRAHPEGVDIVQIRDEADVPGAEQQHLDRRVRQLYPYYEIERGFKGGKYMYRLIGELTTDEVTDTEAISKTLRAKILERDGRRCQMCGRTVSKDKIRLHIDHKIPRAWGGTTDEDNLWALCSECNEGKRDYFASFDPDLMAKVLHHDSVHERICYLLKSKSGEWVESDLIGFVANFDDYQEDWQKRLRECRYFGLEIPSRRRKIGRRVKSFYRVTNWADLPDNPTQFAREYERKRAARNRAKK